MPTLRDRLGHFSRTAAAATLDATTELTEAESPASSPADRLREAEDAWRTHQLLLDSLRDDLTRAAELRRVVLGDQNWEQAAALDTQLASLRTRLEGAEIRDRALGEAVLSAQAQIGQPEAEALRLELARAVEALCVSAHNLVASIETVRRLQLQAGEPNPVIDPRWVNGYMIGKWAEWHHRKVHAEAA